MSELDDLRLRIDELDRRLVDLLAERLGLAAAIGAQKEAIGLSTYDPLREREVLDRVVEAAAGRFPPRHLQAVFREIMSASRASESKQRILVHGTWGGLAHHAAYLRFGAGAKFDLTLRAEDLFAKLEEGIVSYCVVTFEGHSLETSLDRFDLFLHSETSIFGEFYVRPRLGLYAAQAERPNTIYGSPSVLPQASRWMERQSKEHEFRFASTMSEAVRLARSGGGAVLGYPILAASEGLLPLDLGLEDLPESTRRFLILANRQWPSTGQDKTSILAVFENSPGRLHCVTGILMNHGINLYWLEPKATHLAGWDHLFVLEVSGHREDPPVAAALKELRAEVEFLKVLGSYPREMPPTRP
jgi:chorismate mutase / prephenate dehydratase